MLELLQGSPTQKMAQALRYLECEIYYDLREARAMYARNGVVQPCNDRLMAALRYEIADNCEHYVKKDETAPFFVGRDKFYDLRDAHMGTHERDAFKVWLEALPAAPLTEAQVQDYECSVDHMVADCLGGDEGVYARHASRMIVLSAVWRTFEPGYKIDEVLVISGKQGIGKDSMVSALVPWESLYTESFSFGMGLKQKIEQTRGKVFVMASEMGGVTTTRDLEALKSYVTNRNDDIRMAYRRDSDFMARRFVFVCTTNLSRPLPSDPTGNRRWVVVHCDESRVGAVEPWIEARRNKYWAEAVAMYRLGIRPNLPRDMKGIQVGENEQLERVDEQFEDAFEAAVDQGRIKLNGKPMTLTEVAVAMEIVTTEGDFRREKREVQHRIRDQLERNKWTSRRGVREGERTVKRLWFPPS